jgi:hypothetical protein
VAAAYEDRPGTAAQALLDAAALVVVVVVGAYVIRDVVAAGPTDFDDAYMYLRYAYNLIEGQGIAWNAGTPVNGVTSPLHLLVVTGLLAVAPAVDDGRLLQVASTSAGLVALLALAAMCAAAGAGQARGFVRWAAVLMLTIGTTDAFRFHCRTGMDTHLAMLLAAILAAAGTWLARRPTSGRLAMTAGLGFVAILARPDAAPLAFGIPLLCVLLLGEGALRAHAALAFVAALGVLVALDLLLRRWLLGTALPLAFWAKRPGFYGGFAGEHGWNSARFLAMFFDVAWPFLLLLVLFGDRRSLREAAAFLGPVAVTAALLFWPRQIMGHMARFFFPLLPAIVHPAALAVGRRLARGERRAAGLLALVGRLSGGAGLVLGGRAALAAGAVAFEAPAAQQVLATTPEVPTVTGRTLPHLDSWRAAHLVAEIATRAPAGTRMAMSEHGLVAARAPHVHIEDVLGLHDRAFAAGFTVAELWRRAPDLLWLPHPDHTEMLRAILTSPELGRDYLYMPDALTFGLALRRASPRYLALRNQVERAFEAAYPGLRLEDYAALPARTPNDGARQER